MMGMIQGWLCATICVFVMPASEKLVEFTGEVVLMGQNRVDSGKG